MTKARALFNFQRASAPVQGRYKHIAKRGEMQPRPMLIDLAINYYCTQGQAMDRIR
jgi:hypothetical protein